jgi:glycosyltransferase involved in cell wall biosynthesis
LNKISVVIITFNEARNILRCLASVCSVADEIVVVDSFSSDETEAICSAFAVANNIRLRFIQNKFEGHIQQKNFAMQQAANNYILSLDADEALPAELEASILNFKNKNDINTGYTFNRRTSYCGSWIWHCGWYPDRKLRLIDKNAAKWGGTNPHDSLFMHDTTHKTEHLAGDLLHYSFATHTELVTQLDKFSTIAAQARFEKGEKASYFKIFYKTAFKFFRNYILKLGFLDGKNGLIISFWTAKETFWRYDKLRRLNRK